MEHRGDGAPGGRGSLTRRVRQCTRGLLSAGSGLALRPLHGLPADPILRPLAPAVCWPERSRSGVWWPPGDLGLHCQLWVKGAQLSKPRTPSLYKNSWPDGQLTLPGAQIPASRAAPRGVS